MEDTNILYRTLDILVNNVVANAEGVCDQDDSSTRKVLQLTRECHTDSHTERGEQGSEGYSCKAKDIDHHNDQYDPKPRTSYRAYEVP